MGKGATYWGNAEGRNDETETTNIRNEVYSYPSANDMSDQYGVTNAKKTGQPDSQVVPQIKA